MKNVEKKSWLKSQRGGMLVELMLSITIAAIVLPLIVRYQQNAISRAKNIAVAKQIEIVQNALERYINGKKRDFLQHVGNHNWTVKISELEDFGLPEHIADDYGQDYQLSVLKSGTGENTVLQGVVVLNNKDISAFRTREIANLGNGKYGFVDGKEVYGGFNVFQTSTASLGLGNDIIKGIVGTTETTATSGNSMYLWRVSTGDINDSTMDSNLNLNGKNVLNINELHVTGSFAFFNTLKLGEITRLSTLEFKSPTLLDGVTYKTSKLNLINSGNISGDGKHTVFIGDGVETGVLDISTTGTFGTIDTDKLTVHDNLELNGIQLAEDTEIKRVGGTTTVDNVDADTITINGTPVGNVPANENPVGTITTNLRVNKSISSGVKTNFYWDLTKNAGFLKDVMLEDLKGLIQYFCSNSKYYNSKSETAKTFCDSVNTYKDVTVGTCFDLLNKVGKEVTDLYLKQYPKGNGNNNEGRM